MSLVGQPRQRSLAHDTMYRLASQLGVAAFAVVTGVLVARHLGASGKGVVSTVSYLIVLAIAVSELGLGEAAVVLTARRNFDADDAASAAVTTSVLAAVVASTALFAALFGLYHDDFGVLQGGLVAVVLVIPVATAAQVTWPLLEAAGRFDLAAAGRIAAASITAFATALLVYSSGIRGALVAAAIGWVASAAIGIAALRRTGIRIGPRIDRQVIAHALKIGVPIQLSRLLIVVGARFDVIPVAIFAGRAEVGRYSVALTVANLGAYGSSAVIAATYPRLVWLDDARHGSEASALARMALVAALACIIPLAVLTPAVVPFAFGASFRSAVPLTVVLLPGTAAYAVQLAVGRAGAAFARPRVLFLSFLTSLGVMAAGDLVFVPNFGAMAAAVAFTVSNFVGAGVAIAMTIAGGQNLRSFVPRHDDVVRLAAIPRVLRVRLSTSVNAET